MSKLKHYETMFIIKPTLTEEEMVQQIDLVKTNIEKNDGEIVATENIGSKQLAYEIQKNKRGYYYLIYFKSPTSSILELERNYKINENILRFIFIKYENKEEITNWTKLSEDSKKKSKYAYIMAVFSYNLYIIVMARFSELTGRSILSISLYI